MPTFLPSWCITAQYPANCFSSTKYVQQKKVWITDRRLQSSLPAKNCWLMKARIEYYSLIFFLLLSPLTINYSYQNVLTWWRSFLYTQALTKWKCPTKRDLYAFLVSSRFSMRISSPRGIHARRTPSSERISKWIDGFFSVVSMPSFGSWIYYACYYSLNETFTEKMAINFGA